MLQKGIIAQVIDRYTYKVRIPKYDKLDYVTASTKTSDLSTSIVCAIPGIDIAYSLNDVVLVSFENDELSKPVILGLLYRENKSDSDISVSNVDSSLNEIKDNLDKINSSGMYTHLRYSNDNGITFTSLFYPSSYESTEGENIFCQPLFEDSREIKGIPIDKRSRVITWSILDNNNQDITNEIGIETIVFDSNNTIINRTKKEDKQHIITINNSSQIVGDLYLTYKIYVSKEYLDTLHILLTTDKNTFGTMPGEYIGMYISKNSIPSIIPSDYAWFSFSAIDEKLDVEINKKISEIRQEIEDNSSVIYYKEVDWTQQEIDVYCQQGYKGVWERDTVNGYMGEVKAGNVLYITVHNTGFDPSLSDDTYGRLEVRATEDAAEGEAVLGTVFAYDISGEVSINALARFKSDLASPTSETLIYGGNIQTGTINAQQINIGSVISSAGMDNYSIVEHAVDPNNWEEKYGYYKLTEDQTVTVGKSYYNVVGEIIANPDITKNPNFELWYERSGTEGSYIYTLTNDIEVDSMKDYYTVTATKVAEPEDNPQTSGYYELVFNSSLSEYMNNHVTSDGNSLTLSNTYSNGQSAITNGSIKLASDGVFIYDSTGVNVAKYGAETIIGTTEGDNAFYIKIGQSPDHYIKTQDEHVIPGKNYYTRSGSGTLNDPYTYTIVFNPQDVYIDTYYEEKDVPEIGFYQGSDNIRVAYINNYALSIAKTIVLEEMELGNKEFGEWSWKIHKFNNKNNLYLKWLG